MIKNLGVTWEESLKEDLFFKPEIVAPVYTSKGVIPKRSAIYRDDNFISLVSEQYELIENSIVHEVVSDLFGLELNSKMSFNNSNRKFNLVYNIEDDDGTFKNIDKQSEMIPLLIGKNSYDGTRAWTFQFALYRLICSNGMIAPVMTKEIRIKHQKKAGVVINNIIRMELLEKVGELLDNKDRIVDFITEMQNSTEVYLNIDSLKKYSPAMLMLYLGALQKHYLGGFALFHDRQDGTKKYFDLSEVQTDSLAEYIKNITESNRPVEHLLRWQDEMNQAVSQYREQVRNKWEVWQMLIHVAQSYQKKHQRLEESVNSLRLISGGKI